MCKFAAQGMAIIMVSSELPEVMGMSDRILIFREGRINGEVTPANRSSQVRLASRNYLERISDNRRFLGMWATQGEKKAVSFSRHRISAFVKKHSIGIIALLLFAILSFVSPYFLTSRNIISILLQVSINGILTLGMVFVITAGGIDLSIGSMLALTSVIIGMILNSGGSIWLACIVPVIVTTFFGF